MGAPGGKKADRVFQRVTVVFCDMASSVMASAMLEPEVNDRLICEEITATSQADTQTRWRALRATILARRGELAAAEDLAREAVTWAERCEQPDTQAVALAALAEVLRLAGKQDAASDFLDRAARLHESKGNVVAEAKLRDPDALPLVDQAPDPD